MAGMMPIQSHSMPWVAVNFNWVSFAGHLSYDQNLVDNWPIWHYVNLFHKAVYGWMVPILHLAGL